MEVLALLRELLNDLVALAHFVFDRLHFGCEFGVLGFQIGELLLRLPVLVAQLLGQRTLLLDERFLVFEFALQGLD